MKIRYVLAALCASLATAHAQTAPAPAPAPAPAADPAPAPAPAPDPAPAPAPAPAAASVPAPDLSSSTTTQPAEKPPENPDQAGKFNAGGQLRFPSGPDNAGNYASFNWIALDVKGRYNLTDHIAAYLTMPLAVKHPDMPMIAGAPVSPSMFGGFNARAEAGLGKTLGLALTLGFMRQGAFFLSEKDFPMYLGDLKFGTVVGPYFRFKKFGLNITTTPSVAYQAGGSGTAIQVPLSAMVKIGDLVQVAADAGVFTGKLGSGSYEGFGPDDGGRIYAGGSLDVKIKPVIVHAGAGVASLLVDSDPMSAALYHSIGQSIYVDLNVKYAK